MRKSLRSRNVIDRATAERFMAVIHKHSDSVTLDLLFDLTRALGLTLHVEVVDKKPLDESAKV